jgi:hypothetical protein
MQFNMQQSTKWSEIGKDTKPVMATLFQFQTMLANCFVNLEVNFQKFFWLNVQFTFLIVPTGIQPTSNLFGVNSLAFVRSLAN